MRKIGREHSGVTQIHLDWKPKVLMCLMGILSPLTKEI